MIPQEAGAQRGTTGISGTAVSGSAGIRTRSLWPPCLHLPSQQLSGNLGAHVLFTTHLSPGLWSASSVIPEVQFEDSLGSPWEIAATEEGLAAHTGLQTCLQPPGWGPGTLPAGLSFTWVMLLVRWCPVTVSPDPRDPLPPTPSKALRVGAARGGGHAGAG